MLPPPLPVSPPVEPTTNSAQSDRLLGGAVGVQAGKKWTTMRAHFDPEFSRNASMSMVPLYNCEAIQWLADLAKPSSSSVSSTPPVAGGFVRNIAEACRLLPFRLIGLVTYGETFDHEVRLELQATHGAVPFFADNSSSTRNWWT